MPRKTRKQRYPVIRLNQPATCTHFSRAGGKVGPWRQCSAPTTTGYRFAGDEIPRCAEHMPNKPFKPAMSFSIRYVPPMEVLP